MNSLNELWELVKIECQTMFPESIYKMWISDLKIMDFDGEKVVLGVISFKKKIIKVRFAQDLIQAFYNVLGFEIQLEFEEIFDSPAAEVDSVQENPSLYKDSDEATFENFVVGPSNQFANAAAIAVAKDPGGSAYNPLFIHGNSGLGKTHLLNAICHEIKLTNPEANIVFTKGEQFTNDLINHLAQKNMSDFHNKYRSADILLIDDIQFIEGKESTQEEFFHTFNAVVDAGNQVVLTSDVPPQMIKTLSDRLSSRFISGVSADIQPPDLETRMAIIKKNADSLNFKLTEDVVQYIAQRLKENIRQLEGAVKKMRAYVTSQGLPNNITTAQIAIRDMIVTDQPQPITVDKIVQEVARTYGVSSNDIFSKRQDAATVEMRQMAMYLVRELTGMSTNTIGKEFGGKNHTTVLYSISQFEDKLKNRSDLRAKTESIKKNVSEKR